MREFGAGLKIAPNRFLQIAAVMLLLALSTVACTPDPTQPDMATREAFARSVVAAAASGSVEQVEKLVPEVFVNVRPDAQRLVDAWVRYGSISGIIYLSVGGVFFLSGVIGLLMSTG